MRSLIAAGVPIYLEDSIEREVLRVLTRRRRLLGLSYDPSGYFLQFAADVGAIRVPPAPPELIVLPVNKADRHAARAAVHYAATLITADAPLRVECRKANVEEATPWSVIATLVGEHPLEEILRIIPPSVRSGTVFARTTPGGWKGMKDIGLFTVVDIQNIGRLFFDTRTLDWCFYTCFGPKLRLAYPDAGCETSVVSVSFAFPPSRPGGKIVLRAGKLAGTRPMPAAIATNTGPRRPAGLIQLGASLKKDDHWNGHLRHLIVSPARLATDTWKAIVELPDGTPDPMNHDVLDRALRAGFA